MSDEDPIQKDTVEHIRTVPDQLIEAHRTGVAAGKRICAERAKVLLSSIYGLSDHTVHQSMVSFFDVELGLASHLKVPKRGREALSNLDTEAAQEPLPPAPDPSQGSEEEEKDEDEEASDSAGEGSENVNAAAEGAEAT
jgi:hypothetical protein